MNRILSRCRLCHLRPRLQTLRPSSKSRLRPSLLRRRRLYRHCGPCRRRRCQTLSRNPNPFLCRNRSRNLNPSRNPSLSPSLTLFLHRSRSPSQSQSPSLSQNLNHPNPNPSPSPKPRPALRPLPPARPLPNLRVASPRSGARLVRPRTNHRDGSPGVDLPPRRLRDRESIFLRSSTIRSTTSSSRTVVNFYSLR
jgi:hypothetical protein